MVLALVMVLAQLELRSPGTPLGEAVLGHQVPGGTRCQGVRLLILCQGPVQHLCQVPRSGYIAVNWSTVTGDEVTKCQLLPGLLFDILRSETNAHIFLTHCACCEKKGYLRKKATNKFIN